MATSRYFFMSIRHVSSASASLPSLISSLTLLDNISRSVYIKVPAMAGLFRQHFLYFFPLPQGQSSFLPGFFHMQVRYSTKLSLQEYIEQEAWRQAHLDHCPLHPGGRMRSCQAWNICREVPGILSDSPPLRLLGVSCGFDITIYQIHRKRRGPKDYLSTDFSSFLISSASQCLIRV